MTVDKSWGVPVAATVDVAATPGIRVGITGSAGFDGSCEFKLHEFRSPPIAIGPVTMVATFEPEVTADFDLTATGTVAADADMTIGAKLRLGANGYFHPVFSHSLTDNASFDTSSEAKIAVGGSFSFGPGVGDGLAGATAGLYADVDPVQFSVTNTSKASSGGSACSERTWGGEASAGLNAQAWAGPFSGQARDAIFQGSWTYGQPSYLPTGCNAGGPVITTVDLPTGEVGQPFSTDLTTQDHRQGTWRVSSGSLPYGLTLSDYTISGTPMTSGTYSFGLTFTDSQGRQTTATASLIVDNSDGTPPGEDTHVGVAVAAPPGTVAAGYEWDLPTYGDEDMGQIVSWSVTGGALPPGTALQYTNDDGEYQAQVTGTPTTSGTFTVTLTATDSQGHVVVKQLSVLISALPTDTTYTLGGSRFGFTPYVFSADGGVVTREDTTTGATVDVGAAVGFTCPTNGVLNVVGWSRNGRFAELGCGWDYSYDDTSLYLADIDGGSYQRLDVPDAGYTASWQTIEGYSQFGFDSAGPAVSNDGKQAIFVTSELLDTAAGSETSTIDHLYDRDVATGTTSLIAAPGARYIISREAAISSDGNYIDELGTGNCSGPDGGACGDSIAAIHRSPDAATNATLCASACIASDWWLTGAAPWSISDDGLRVGYSVNQLSDATGTWEYSGDRVDVLDARTDGLIATPTIPLGTSDGVGFPPAQGLLSPDGSLLFYTSNVAPYTCQLSEASFPAPGGLSTTGTVGDPPDGLPLVASQPWCK